MPQKALQLLLLFAGWFGFVAVFTVIDGQHRKTVEIVEYPTALGDDRFFPNEAEFSLHDPVVELDGKPLYRASNNRTKKRDWLMRPETREDSANWVLYRETLPRGSHRELDPNLLYLKSSKNRYIRLTRKAFPEG